MNKTQIIGLIDFIKTDPTLEPLFGDRVFYVQSLNKQTELSLYINILAENRKQISNETMIDFRIISNNIEVSALNIQEYIDKVKDVFEKNSEYFGSHYYQIDILTDVFIETNSKNNFEGIFTIIFKNTK